MDFVYFNFPLNFINGIRATLHQRLFEFLIYGFFLRKHFCHFYFRWWQWIWIIDQDSLRSNLVSKEKDKKNFVLRLQILHISILCGYKLWSYLWRISSFGYIISPWVLFFMTTCHVLEQVILECFSLFLIRKTFCELHWMSWWFWISLVKALAFG